MCVPNLLKTDSGESHPVQSDPILSHPDCVKVGVWEDLPFQILIAF